MGSESGMIVVDGSNVIRAGRRSDIRNLAKLLERLDEKERNYTAVVDASVRHDFGNLFKLPLKLKERLIKEDGIPVPVRERFKRAKTPLSDNAKIRERNSREWKIIDGWKKYSIRSWSDRDDREHLDAYDLRNKERVQFERMLEDESITQAPAGTPADLTILRYAQDHPDSQILTNDRYYEYTEKYPLVRDEGRFIRFTILNGEPQLIEPERTEVKEAPKGIEKPPAEEAAPEPPEGTAKVKTLRGEVVLQPPEEAPERIGRKIAIPGRTGIMLTGAGQAILWGALLWRGFPAVTWGTQIALGEFSTHFLVFLFIAITGVVLTKWGVGETRNRELLDEALKYSMVGILACTALSLGLGSIGDTAGARFLTRIAYAVTAVTLGGVTYGIARS